MLSTVCVRRDTLNFFAFVWELEIEKELSHYVEADFFINKQSRFL